MRKNTGNWALPGIVFVGAFAMSAACGSEAPNLSGSDCPVQENPSTTVTSTNATTGTGGTTTSGPASTAASVTVTTGASTGSGMEAPQYDVPAADEIAARLHSCHKLTYAQLGNFLRARGVLVPSGAPSDLKTAMVTINGVNKTLGALFGGTGSACEILATPGVGGTDPLCGAGETCFCSQNDKTDLGIACTDTDQCPTGRICDLADTLRCVIANRNCVDVGTGSGAEAPDGYCIAAPKTAGFLYFSAGDALGVAKLDSRLGDADEHTTASAAKLFDIFVQAAPQIIANIADPTKAPACTLNGKNLPMFDPNDGSCVEQTLSCLLGMPASQDHLLLCNLMVQKANVADLADVAKKRHVAIAALLSGVHACQ